MAIAWNPMSLAGLSAAALALAISALLARQRRPANRRLALVLAAEGLAAATGTGLLYLMDDPGAARSVQLVATALSLTIPSLYLVFLGTLPTRLVAPWRGRRGALVAAALALALEAALVARPRAFVEGVTPTWYASWEAVPGQFAWVPAVLLLAVSLYGFAAALAAHREAPPATTRRARARAYAIAFGARDALLAFILVAPLVGAALAPGRAWDLFPVIGFPLTLLVYVPALAYGILRTQLFDVELRVKGGVRSATVVGAFLALYVLVSQMAALVLPRHAVLIGVAAAGGLVAFIRPLDAFAQRVAARLMPGVGADEGYLERRKLEAYRAALEDAVLGRDVLRPADESHLAQLRWRLGITEREHVILLEAARAAPSAGLAQGARLVAERYAVERSLAGGKALLARDALLGRAVVLKRATSDAALAEARRLARLADPHVVTLHDVARDAEGAWLVLEHAEGGSLAERLARGPLTQGEFARIADGLLAGLASAHEAGILHRDVKPSNVMLTASGAAKLADFGALADSVGTPRYASPEQMRGAPLTPASDVWSAACTLREALGGEIPRPLAPWFERALAPEPGERYADAGEARRALALILSSPRTPGASDPRR